MVKLFLFLQELLEWHLELHFMFFEWYEGNSKSFRTFIFSRATVRVGGVVIGRVWECHVTSQSGNRADLAV